MSQSVLRALELLSAVQTSPQTLLELATRIGVHKSTVLRLLQTLESRGYVKHDSTHRYSLGTTVFELATASLASLSVVKVARTTLEHLNNMTGHTVHLAVLQRADAVYVDKIDATGPIRMYSQIGLRAPLHCTAVGKVLVAHSTRRQELLRVYEFTKFTDRTILTLDSFIRELNGVASQGWAKDFGEHEPSMNCIAAPIYDGLGTAVAALSISVPGFVTPRSQVKLLVPHLLQSAGEVSAALGSQITGPSPAR